MTDSNGSRNSNSGSGGSDGMPYVGVASTEDAADALEAVSSQIYEYTGVPGKASEPGPGVTECAGKNKDKYFRVYHPWNFQPKSVADIDLAMKNLKKKLNTGGWVVKNYYRDNSQNKNLTLVADNDATKVSVRIVQYAKRQIPSLGITTVSGCYQVPQGEKIKRF